MNHKFSVLFVDISGMCETCEQFVVSRESISGVEMERYKDNFQALREFKLGLAYDKFKQYECKP